MKKIFSLLFAVLFVVFGVIAIVSGVHKLQSKGLYDASTTAKIVGIEREWTGTDSDGFDQYDYHVYVTYKVDGVTYEQKEYPGYSNSMQDGDEIEILYQSSTPENISEKNITGNAIIFIAVGAVLIIAGILSGVKAIVRP